MRAVWSRCVAILVVASGIGSLVVAGCSTPPTDPTPQLQISCPTSKTVESLTGDPVAVDFEAATSTGGTQPLTVTCMAPSGSSFPVGTTNVICTARDAMQQSASCGLNVTVTRVGELSVTRFLAFGDSITFGSPGGPGGLCEVPAGGAMTSALHLRELRSLRPRADSPPPPSAYPNVLRSLLSSRYRNQSFVVDNNGEPGEYITEDGGTFDDTLDRLRAALSARRPHVLLLQEGINDLNELNHHPEEIPRIVKALRDMIAEARGSGVRVLLGTLLPQEASGCRGHKGFDLVGPANEQIRTMAAGEGVTVVDLYEGFGRVPGPYIGFDGLHPNESGYEKMAQIFLDTIKKTLEVPR